MHTPTRFAANRPLDVICLGRLAMDLYAQQIGAPLEEATSFAKYLGGSSANCAFGCARLGVRSAMLARVGDDHPGRFLRTTLAQEGCDVSHVHTDPQRLTALVLLGIKDRDTFPLIFYRENCADMAIDESDFDEAFIASSKALAITGTHLSTALTHRACLAALTFAHRNNVRTILDIDYRPVLWGLTGKADGETRFIAAGAVTTHLQAILPLFDLVVGTIEEFNIAGGATDIMASLRAVRGVTQATLVVKRGSLGCCVIADAIPDTLDAAFNFRGVQVEVLNVLGAGDAFIAGFLKGWLNGEDYEACCRYANACGALVVSRHGCAPAMPTQSELAYFLANAERLIHPDQDAVLARLHRTTVSRVVHDEVCAFAFDHRTQFFEMAQETGANVARLPQLKRLFVTAVAQSHEALGLAGSTGVLIDDRYGQDALNEATGRGWWIGRPVELPGSNPLEFERGRSIGSQLVTWPRDHIVKCLVTFHPDDETLHRLEQEAQIRSLYDATRESGHELLLEIIPPRNRPRMEDTVLRALQRLYNLRIYPEWWKLEPLSSNQWDAVDKLIHERDPQCRGVVLLGLAADVDVLAAGFASARDSTTCCGFAVGRTIFGEPARMWLAGTMDDQALIVAVRKTYEALIKAWREARSSAAVRGA